MKKSIIGFTAAGALLLAGCGSSDPADFDFQSVSHNACTSAIKGKLKSASTAKFDGLKSTQADSGEWTVLGSVDSENGFGAMSTADFACEVIVSEPRDDGKAPTETKIIFMQQR